MKQTRTFNFTDRVVTASDLRRIVAIFERLKERDGGSLSFAVKFHDGTSLESSTGDVLTEDALPSSARLEQIAIRFRGSSRSKEAALQLQHGSISLFSTNDFNLTSTDTEWLRATFLEITEALNGMKAQECWIRRHRVLAILSLSAAIAPLVDLFAVGVSRLYLGKVERWDYRPSWLAQIFIAGAVLTGWIYPWLLEAWPRVEIAIGPEHLRPEVKQRKRLGIVATLIVVPILLDVIKARLFE